MPHLSVEQQNSIHAIFFGFPKGGGSVMDKQKKRVQRLVENIQKNHAGVCQAKKLLLFVFLATLTKKICETNATSNLV